jgi:hypothetical protein
LTTKIGPEHKLFKDLPENVKAGKITAETSIIGKQAIGSNYEKKNGTCGVHYGGGFDAGVGLSAGFPDD